MVHAASPLLPDGGRGERAMGGSTSACTANPKEAASRDDLVRAHRASLITLPRAFAVPHSCARARTVASEVFTEAQSFADCKLHIRTRLSASAFSNFWKTQLSSELVVVFVSYMYYAI